MLTVGRIDCVRFVDNIALSLRGEYIGDYGHKTHPQAMSTSAHASSFSNICSGVLEVVAVGTDSDQEPALRGGPTAWVAPPL